MYKYENNCIEINNKIYEFKFDIRTVLEYKCNYIVLISIPEKGQIVTANLGMNMITQGKSSVAVGVRINKEQLNGFVKVGDYMPTQENNEKIVFEKSYTQKLWMS